SFRMCDPCSLPAIHEDPVDVKIADGGKLELTVPAPTTIWHRKFEDGRPEEYVETPNQYLDVSNVWRSGTLGVDHSPAKIEVGEDGKLTMPQVTSSDSAQYYTYYRAEDGVHHYKYFNVKIGN
ncbi:hypothetical protein PENTCL1PPCAC_7300, partial [Pristionchus entomophagus]